MSDPPPPASKQNAPLLSTLTAWADLPDQAVDRILTFADPETYASLLVLNRRWRRHADHAHLYALQLYRSLPASRQAQYANLRRPTPSDRPKLRRRFAQQIQHHFWAPYRPKKQSFNLVAPFVPSATANPLGENIDYNFSPQGRWLLASTSSRIFVLSLERNGPTLSRSCKVKRRPLSVVISEDGDTLAVLARDSHVNIYSFSSGDTRPAHVIALKNPAKCVALSPDCSMLVAGSAAGLELVSLRSMVAVDNGTGFELLKRFIPCPAVDLVYFDPHGSAILATSLGFGSTTVVYPPVEDDLAADQPLESEADLFHTRWTTRALHSKSYQKCTHASLLRFQDNASANRAVAFDIPAGAFGVLDLQDLRFLDSAWSPPSSLAQTRPSAITTPVASADSRLVAVGIRRQGISLYRLRGIKSRSRPIVMPHTREIRLPENIQTLRWIASRSEDGQSLPTAHCLAVASSNTAPAPKPFTDSFEFEDNSADTTGMVTYLDFRYHASIDEGKPITVYLEGVPLQTLDDPVGTRHEPFPISELDASEPSSAPRTAESTTLAPAITTVQPPPPNQSLRPAVESPQPAVKVAQRAAEPIKNSIKPPQPSVTSVQPPTQKAPFPSQSVPQTIPPTQPRSVPIVSAMKTKQQKDSPTSPSAIEPLRAARKFGPPVVAPVQSATPSTQVTTSPLPNGIRHQRKDSIPEPVSPISVTADDDGNLPAFDRNRKADRDVSRPGDDEDGTPYRRTMSMRRVFSDTYDSIIASTQRPHTPEVSAVLSAFRTTSRTDGVMSDSEKPPKDASKPIHRRRTSTSAVNILSMRFDDPSEQKARREAGMSTRRPQSAHLLGGKNSFAPPMPPLPAVVIPPAAPTAEQLASLSRRYSQTVPLARPNGVPRAAALAHRRSTVSAYGVSVIPNGIRTPGFTSQTSLVAAIPEESASRENSMSANNAPTPTSRPASRADRLSGMPRLNTIQSVTTLGARSDTRSDDASSVGPARQEALAALTQGPTDPDDNRPPSSIPPPHPSQRRLADVQIINNNKDRRRSRLMNPQMWMNASKPTKQSRSRIDTSKCTVM